MSRTLGGGSQRHLQTLFVVGVTADLSDRELLERFALGRESVAELSFAAIMDRHGPMVRQTCLGILGDHHEAQDAFQATFLVLVRKRRSLWVVDSLGPWLHRVACRASTRARRGANRRQLLARRIAESARGRTRVEGTGDLAKALHEEVDRLPARFRAAVILCDLEGQTYESAARLLGCPLGTIKSRLARGRNRLRDRLTRRGLPASLVAPFAVDSVAKGSPTVVPRPLGESISRIAIQIRAGTSTAGTIPASVAALLEGVLKTMFLDKLKAIAVGTVATVALTVGTFTLAQQATGGGPPDVPITQPPSPTPEKAREAGGNPRPIASMDNGATLEVVGISTRPSLPDMWWNPDGLPLTLPPCDPSEVRVHLDGEVIMRTVVVRLRGLPPGADHRWGVVEAVANDSGPATIGGEAVPDLEEKGFAFPKDQARCTIFLEVAAGPWKNVYTTDGKGALARGDRNGTSLASNKAIASKLGTSITFTHDAPDLAVRVVAANRMGNQYPGRIEVTGFGTIRQLTAEFEMEPKAIRDFVFQTRPYERVEVGDVALWPSGTISIEPEEFRVRVRRSSPSP